MNLIPHFFSTDNHLQAQAQRCLSGPAMTLLMIAQDQAQAQRPVPAITLMIAGTKYYLQNQTVKSN